MRLGHVRTSGIVDPFRAKTWWVRWRMGNHRQIDDRSSQSQGIFGSYEWTLGLAIPWWPQFDRGLWKYLRVKWQSQAKTKRWYGTHISHVCRIIHTHGGMQVLVWHVWYVLRGCSSRSKYRLSKQCKTGPGIHQGNRWPRLAWMPRRWWDQRA